MISQHRHCRGSICSPLTPTLASSCQGYDLSCQENPSAAMHKQTMRDLCRGTCKGVVRKGRSLSPLYLILCMPPWLFCMQGICMPGCSNPLPCLSFLPEKQENTSWRRSCLMPWIQMMCTEYLNLGQVLFKIPLGCSCEWASFCICN